MEPGRALHLELCHPDQRCCSAQVCMPHSSMHRVFGQSQLAKPGFPIGVALPAGSAQVRGREPQQRPIVQTNVATHHPGQIGSPVCCGPPFFQPGKRFPCTVFLGRAIWASGEILLCFSHNYWVPSPTDSLGNLLPKHLGCRSQEQTASTTFRVSLSL